MYTGRVIDELIRTVQRHEQGVRLTRPVIVKMAPKVEARRSEMQAFFYHMHATGQIPAGMA
jgi:hypothetical protein